MTISVKKILFSTLWLMVLLIGRDLTTYSAVSAQSAPSFMIWSADSRRLAVSIEAGALVIEGGRIISRCAVDGTVSALAFTPDGESLYVGTNEGGIMACNARTGRKPGLQQQIIPRPTRIVRFEFSADGSRMFVSSGAQAPDGFYLFDTSLTLLGDYNPLGFDMPAPEFLPDGMLLTFTRDGDVLTVEREGQPDKQITLPGPTQYVGLSSNDRFLMASTVKSDMSSFDLWVYDFETGEQVSHFDQGQFVMATGDDMAMIAAVGPSIVNLRTGEVLAQYEWLPNGLPMLFIQNDAGVLLRQAPTDHPTLFRLDTGEMMTLDLGQKVYTSVDFGLDDNLLLFGVTETETDIITYPLSGMTVPSKRSIASLLSWRVQTVGGHAFGLFDNQTLMVFDVSTGETLHEHAIPSLNWDVFAVRPDGNAYAVREGQTLTIRTLEGDESVITLPN